VAIQAQSSETGEVRRIFSNRLKQRPHLEWRSDAEGSICVRDGDPQLQTTTAGDLRDPVVHRYARLCTWQRTPLGNYQLKQIVTVDVALS